MELIYTDQRTGFEPGKAYANARFFAEPRPDVTRVVVLGNFPKIVAAYEALNVPVEVRDPAEAEPTPSLAPIHASEEPVTIPDDYESLPWSRPAEPGGMTLRSLVKDLGETAINRKQAIEVIRKHA